MLLASANYDCEELFMKKKYFNVENDGLYGTYYENPNASDCTVLGCSAKTLTAIWRSAG